MLLTAVLFIVPITTVIITVTYMPQSDTSTCVSAFELVITCYAVTCKTLA